MNRFYYLRRPRRIKLHNDGTYSFSAEGEAVVCIASLRDPESGAIKYGYSIVSPNEKSLNKPKSFLRNIAESRLNKNPIEFVSTGKSAFAITRSIIEHLKENLGKRHGTVRKMANLWLREGSVHIDSKMKLVFSD